MNEQPEKRVFNDLTETIRLVKKKDEILNLGLTESIRGTLAALTDLSAQLRRFVASNTEIDSNSHDLTTLLSETNRHLINRDRDRLNDCLGKVSTDFLQIYHLLPKGDNKNDMGKCIEDVGLYKGLLSEGVRI